MGWEFKMMIFSNDWINWLWNNFSMVIVAFPSIIAFGLKLIAIFHPKIPSDKIIDLFKQYWPKEK